MIQTEERFKSDIESMEGEYQNSLGILRTEIEKSTATMKEYKSFAVVSAELESIGHLPCIILCWVILLVSCNDIIAGSKVYMYACMYVMT